MGSSSPPPKIQKCEEVNIYLNLIVNSLNNLDGEAPPIQGININQNANKNSINVVLKREGNECKIVSLNENQNVNLKINGERINMNNSSETSQGQNKDNNIDNKDSVLRQKIEENFNTNTFGNNIDNNEEQKKDLNQKINSTLGKENEYNPFYGKNNLKNINNEEKTNTNKPNNDNNIERNNNDQMDNNADNLANRLNNDNNINKYNNNNKMNDNANNLRINNDNHIDMYNKEQKDINENNNDNLNSGETIKNNDNNIEHNNDEDKLSMSQSVLWASFRDLNINNQNDKQIFIKNFYNKLEEGFFPLYAKIENEKSFFYYIKQERTLKSLLTAHLLKCGITFSGEEYSLYNDGNKLDPDCPINEMNDLKIFSVIEIRKRK